MKLGIVGLPNVGKSTLFNAITKAGAEVANYPFCTIEPNLGVVAVPDERLDRLYDIYKRKRKVNASIEFSDIAGLVKGASKGEGLGNQFLGHIRQVEAIVHVVRCFESDNIVHVAGEVDSSRDIEIIETELILSDIEILERRIARAKNVMKGGDRSGEGGLEIMQRIYEQLSEGRNARAMHFEESSEAFVKSLGLLSYKPVIYAANLDEASLADLEGDEHLKIVRRIAEQEGSEVIALCAEIEAQMAELSEEEREEFMSELGIGESGLSKLIKASYSLLELISFFTVGDDECRAWTIKRGTKAPRAAGKIHTDFERGFIRAECVAFDKFIEAGSSISAVREKGLLRSEGKDYVVRDGDIINFLFNV